MSDIIISYKETIIDEINDSGTKTLETAGKYCEDDIVINYTARPGTKEDDIIMRIISENYENSRVTSIGYYAFTSCRYLTTVSFPVCTTIGNSAFANCRSLTTANFPACTSIGLATFSGCSYLTTANFPACTTIAMYAFSSCRSLTTANFPVCTSIGAEAFASCGSLTTASFPACTRIESYAFISCSKLATVILNTSQTASSIYTSTFYRCYNLTSLYLLASTMYKLGNINAFTSTPISNYTTSTGGVYGSIFVRESLYASYIASTNWATYSARFVSLTDAQVANVMASGTHT